MDKRTPIVLQTISLVLCVLILLKTTEFWSSATTDWLLPIGGVSLALLLLTMVFSVTILIALFLPLHFSGRDELMFGAGFGVCLGLMLIDSVSMKLGIVQTIASFVLGTYSRTTSSATRPR